MEWSWRSWAITDVGKVREVNEDNLLDASASGFWVVADGMGGHDSGDVASTLIVDRCAAIANGQSLSGLVNSAEQRLVKVNEELLEIARKKDSESVVGSTFVGLFVENGWGVCLWVGDSRLYRLRDENFMSVSRDHCDVEDLIDRGEVLREDAESHPLANVINRAVGGGPGLYVDAQLMELQNKDRYLLCSDGLYKEMSEPEIADVLRNSSSAESATKRLVDTSLERGCRDNISVIVVDLCNDGSLNDAADMDSRE